MRGSFIERVGDARSIRYGELPEPVAGAAEAVVRVDAVAVNRVDTFVRSGRWPTPLSLPVAVGRDLVGTVVSVGARANGLAPGDRVWTNSAGYDGRPGATAELVAVERERLYPLPATADPVAFVAALHPGATAHGVVFNRAGVAPGERVAVTGANGAVGMCVVQAAAARGAHVVAICRDRRAEVRLRALGAGSVVIADGVGAPAALASHPGVDVFVDASGQTDVGAVAGRLNPRGRIVVIAGSGGIDLERWGFYVRELALLGFVMSAMTVAELAGAAQWINSTFAAQPVTVSVGAVMGFDQAAEAHALLEAGRLPRMSDGTVGRIVLRP